MNEGGLRPRRVYEAATRATDVQAIAWTSMPVDSRTQRYVVGWSITKPRRRGTAERVPGGAGGLCRLTDREAPTVMKYRENSRADAGDADD